MNVRSKPLIVTTAVAGAVLGLAACGEPSGTTAEGSAQGSDSTYGTRTVTDCNGLSSTFSAAPQRVVTVTTSVLEFLLAMGLEDRVVGIQAVAPGAFPDDLQPMADALPKLGGEYVPGNFVPVQREQLLETSPDLVIGGWPANFDATKGALAQEELTERGINSYYAHAVTCERTAPVTDLSVVYKDIENYGTIFDEEEAAEDLVAEMRNTVQETQDAVADEDRPRVFSYSWEDGAGEAYAMGNQHLGNAIITQAGGINIFEDVDTVYGDAGWEEVVDRDPEYILIQAFGKATAQEFDQVIDEAKNFFTTDPAFQNMTAVKEGNFIAVQDETYYVGGVRNADAVADLARALHPDAFDE